MKRLFLLLALSGCATTQTAEGRKEAARDAIHARHNWCMQRADTSAATSRGVDAMATFWCHEEAERECLSAGLERQCSQWQSGGT